MAFFYVYSIVTPPPVLYKPSFDWSGSISIWQNKLATVITSPSLGVEEEKIVPVPNMIDEDLDTRSNSWPPLPSKQSRPSPTEGPKMFHELKSQELRRVGINGPWKRKTRARVVGPKSSWSGGDSPIQTE